MKGILMDAVLKQKITKKDRVLDQMIGGKVRIARRLAKMSQRNLAKAVGCSSIAISKWEAGERSISAAMLHKIEQVLKIDVPTINIREDIEQSSMQSLPLNKGDLCGYIEPHKFKFQCLILFFSQNGISRIELARLLFLVDFLHCKKWGKSLTGSCYINIAADPIPTCYKTTLSVPHHATDFPHMQFSFQNHEFLRELLEDGKLGIRSCEGQDGILLQHLIAKENPQFYMARYFLPGEQVIAEFIYNLVQKQGSSWITEYIRSKITSWCLRDYGTIDYIRAKELLLPSESTLDEILQQITNKANKTKRSRSSRSKEQTITQEPYVEDQANIQKPISKKD